MPLKVLASKRYFLHLACSVHNLSSCQILYPPLSLCYTLSFPMPLSSLYPPPPSPYICSLKISSPLLYYILPYPSAKSVSHSTHLPFLSPTVFPNPLSHYTFPIPLPNTTHHQSLIHPQSLSHTLQSPLSFTLCTPWPLLSLYASPIPLTRYIPNPFLKLCIPSLTI